MQQVYTNTGDFFGLCPMYHQLVKNSQVANICTSTLFPQHGKYPQLTKVCHIDWCWEPTFTAEQQAEITQHASS